MAKYNRFTQRERESIVHRAIPMIRDGKTRREISEHFGVSHESIRQWLLAAVRDGLYAEHEINNIGIGQYSPEDQERMTHTAIQMLKDGLSQKEISIEIDLQTMILRKWLKEAREKGLYDQSDIKNKHARTYTDACKEDFIPKIVELVNQGMTHKQIGNKLGIAQHSVLMWLKQAVNKNLIDADVIRSTSHRLYTPAQRKPITDKALELLESGVSFNVASKQVGVTDVTLGRWLKDIGVCVKKYKKPNRYKYTPEQREALKREIVELREMGWSLIQIGEKLGVSTATIGKWLQSMEVRIDKNAKAKREMVRLRELGWSGRWISKKLGIGESTIFKWLKKIDE